MSNNIQIVDTNSLRDEIFKNGKRKIIFDFFDTIVHRKIHPEDIKKIVCSRLLTYYKIENLTADQVYDIRAGIERELCSKNQNIGFDLEFRIKEMAAALYDNLKAQFSNQIEKEDFISKCREVELVVELSNQLTDVSIVNCIKELFFAGYDIYICSDIYFDLEFMNELLSAHKISKYIKKAFISSEYNFTKRSGRLYNEVLINLDPKECIMIGDNYESDALNANSKGIDSIHINRSWIHQLYGEYKSKFHSNSFFERVNNLFKTNEHILFKEFSLTSFYFIHLLYLELQQKKCKEVFFLAREGYFLKEMFDLYQKICMPGCDKILSHYLKASRRSTFIPSLKKIEKENFFNLFRQYRKISTNDFLYSLGFSDEEINTLTQNLNIDRFKREADFPTSEAFIKLIISDQFDAMYENRRVCQKNTFIKYINSFSELGKSEIALVDVGWKGTIQDNIYGIFDNQINVVGFYMGLVVNPDNSDTRNTKKGLLFSVEKRDRYYGIFDENRSFFEVLLAADHGSTLSYELNKKGNPHALTEDYSNELSFFKSKIYPLINQILQLFKSICFEYNSCCVQGGDLYEFVARNHARMFLFPSANELDWHRDLYHVENFGVFEKNKFNKEKNKISIFEKINHYYFYKKNPEKFITNVVWPAAEFSRCGLRASFKKYSKNKFSSTFKQ